MISEPLIDDEADFGIFLDIIRDCNSTVRHITAAEREKWNKAATDTATTAAAGLMSAADKTKLGGIATAATANAKTALTPLMNGTAAIGNDTGYAVGNHVHPADTSRAPTSHASAATTYGIATASNYGHAMASGAAPSAAGTAAAGTDNGKFAREGHVHPAQTSVSGSSGSCTGNAATATKLATTRAINVSGAATAAAGGISGTAQNFDGTANITIAATVPAATASAAGVMLPAEKTKLAGIAPGAGNISFLTTINTDNKTFSVPAGRNIFVGGCTPSNYDLRVPAGIVTYDRLVVDCILGVNMSNGGSYHPSAWKIKTVTVSDAGKQITMDTGYGQFDIYLI